jgi:hypothetical protein
LIPLTPCPSFLLPLTPFTPEGNYPCRELPLTSSLNAMDYSKESDIAFLKKMRYNNSNV